jgi:hypothetical protein
VEQQQCLVITHMSAIVNIPYADFIFPGKVFFRIHQIVFQAKIG